MYRYSDSTLMGMTKKELIEHYKCAEYNEKQMWEILNQQAKNFEKLENEIRKDERTKILNCFPICYKTEFKCELSENECFECMRQALNKIEKQLNK